PTPSIVVILLCPTAPIGVWQARTGCPSTCTVQAPQSAAPHPNLVPVRPSSSRSAHSSGVSSGRFTLCCRPLTLTEVIAVLLSSIRRNRSRVQAEYHARRERVNFRRGSLFFPSHGCGLG